MEIPMQTTKVYEMPVVSGFAHTKHYLVCSEEQHFLQVLQVKDNSLIRILPREIEPTEFYLRNTATPVRDERVNKIRALAYSTWH
jgi:hypothetical protein